jgi:sugar lactone lactonase YvrE
VPGFALDQQAGVQVISNPKSPRPPDGKRKQILFKEEISIGVVEGDENYMFGESIIFNTDEEGNFYITDWDRRRIQKYKPAYSLFFKNGKAYAVATEDDYKFAKRYAIETVDEGQR